ncbi:ammonium transporter [Echinococcus multilocularis]|uniref:Ammonium transporter n=1 Tax=Echinococcus multilocularis TaxID=6211 RepID=A0A0S4MIV5_ECHMU|nr:ammonium transporter [Echinococcus multilocularis]
MCVHAILSAFLNSACTLASTHLLSHRNTHPPGFAHVRVREDDVPVHTPFVDFLGAVCYISGLQGVPDTATLIVSTGRNQDYHPSRRPCHQFFV